MGRPWRISFNNNMGYIETSQGHSLTHNNMGYIETIREELKTIVEFVV